MGPIFVSVIVFVVEPHSLPIYKTVDVTFFLLCFSARSSALKNVFQKRTFTENVVGSFCRKKICFLVGSFTGPKILFLNLDSNIRKIGVGEKNTRYFARYFVVFFKVKKSSAFLELLLSQLGAIVFRC